MPARYSLITKVTQACCSKQMWLLTHYDWSNPGLPNESYHLTHVCLSCGCISVIGTRNGFRYQYRLMPQSNAVNVNNQPGSAGAIHSEGSAGGINNGN